MDVEQKRSLGRFKLRQKQKKAALTVAFPYLGLLTMVLSITVCQPWVIKRRRDLAFDLGSPFVAKADGQTRAPA